jgi:zinc/manganese transport system substrate-binding protein
MSCLPALMRLRIGAGLAGLVVVALLAAGCSGGGAAQTPGPPSVVVTYPVLGSVVADLVGDRATVTVLMGNGVDPHDWSPSAKDIERVDKADLVVANGLNLEEGLEKALVEAEKRGVVVFRATDHVTVRQRDADGEDSGEAGADPHFWVDPRAMRDVVLALAPALAAVGVDVADRAPALATRLADLDAATRSTLSAIPEARRLLVTGHESMGYFADRYGFRLVGAVVPGLTSQGEVAAGQLADLRAAIEAEGVTVIFTEIGTPSAVVEAIGRETGAAVVLLPSHTLPADGTYASFIGQIATAIATALR